MRKTTWAVAMISALALATPMALSQGPGGPGGRGGSGKHDGTGMHGALARLDLDDAQRDAIRALFHEFSPRIEDAQAVVDELGAELHEVAAETGFNDAVLRPIAEARGAATAEVTMLRIEMHTNIRELLTPEQLEELEEMRNRHGSFGRSGGHHPGHGPRDGSGQRQAPGGGN